MFLSLVAAMTLAAACVSSTGAGVAGADAGVTRIVVGASPRAGSTVRAVEQALGATVVLTLGQVDAHVIAVPAARVASAITLLRRLPGVRYVQLDGRAYAAGVPNDEYWFDEWSAVATHAPAAWDLTTGSPSVVVAVVDTGVDPSQPDLQGRVLAGYDFVGDDADALDDNGHGTAVAGVVAAQGDNGIGVAGFCWQCRIVPVKVLGSDGSGFNSAVAAGILWSVDHGAKVVNTSLGSVADDLVVAAAAQYAEAHGVLVVAAAGNDGSATLEYPAALPGVLSVGASDPNDQAYSFSNRGAAVAAPGENVTTGTQGTYVSFLGTSSATPVVSGIAALALSAAPDATPAAITQALESTAVPSDGAVYGRVDAYAAVHQLAPELGAQVGSPAPAETGSTPSTTPQGPPARDRTTATLDVRGVLTPARRRRIYVLRTGGGALHARLAVANPGRVPLELRLTAVDGTEVARRRGRGALRLNTTVDPMTYRIVVSRQGAGRPVSYRLVLDHPEFNSSRR
jgi:subtilisin family serine protease